jgi:hypothetical protein
MVKIYAIYSEYSSEPLAVIRTDGGVVDFATDNTNGEITHGVIEKDIPKQQQFAALQAKIADTSHLKMVEKTPDKPFYMLRYTLNNGDVVEITADGLSCFLNGEMLTHFEKNALFDAIRTGAIKVVGKTDYKDAIPFGMPVPKKEPADIKYSPEQIEKFHKKMEESLQDEYDRRGTEEYKNQQIFDLLKPYYLDLDPSEVEFCKHFLKTINYRR